MTTLDRYVARQFLLNAILLVLLLAAFVLTVDVSLNLQRFVAYAERTSRDTGHEPTGLRKALLTVLLVADLWWPRLLLMYNYVVGLVLVGAMGFTFAQLARHREFVAVMAGGIPLWRLLRPVMLVATIFIAAQVLNQELVIPRIAALVARDNREITRRDFSDFPVNLTADGRRRLFQARSFRPSEGLLLGVHIYERDEQGRAFRRISASAARYQDGAWLLENPTVTLLAPPPTPATPPASAPPARIESDLQPVSLLADRYRIYSHTASWGEIIRSLSATDLKQDVRDQLLRVAWGRVALIACTYLSILVAIPFFLTREPRNMVLQSIKCAPVALGSILGSVVGTLAPIPGLPPEVSVWVPVLILLPTAVAMASSLRT